MDGKERSLASVRRARLKEKKNQETDTSKIEPKKVVREVNIPDKITIKELSNRMATQGSLIIKHLLNMGVVATINHNLDADTAEYLVKEFGNIPIRERKPDLNIQKIDNKAKKNNEIKIEVWGDGMQTRTFLYVDDCIEGTLRLFESDYSEPVNIGSDEQVSINQMIEIIEDISGIKKLERVYQLDKPKGVRGRSSNNDLVKEVLNWSFKIKLKEGLKKTYDWISAETSKEGSNLSRFTKS